ncbi:hypothetical protein P8452_05359 [Trifolium repens]|nr:hypothetical protein P8452_05359 [Trifolium repens]
MLSISISTCFLLVTNLSLLLLACFIYVLSTLSRLYQSLSTHRHSTTRLCYTTFLISGLQLQFVEHISQFCFTHSKFSSISLIEAFNCIFTNQPESWVVLSIIVFAAKSLITCSHWMHKKTSRKDINTTIWKFKGVFQISHIYAMEGSDYSTNDGLVIWINMKGSLVAYCIITNASIFLKVLAHKGGINNVKQLLRD